MDLKKLFDPRYPVLLNLENALLAGLEMSLHVLVSGRESTIRVAISGGTTPDLQSYKSLCFVCFMRRTLCALYFVWLFFLLSGAWWYFSPFLGP